MNRVVIKDQAKKVLSNNMWNFWKAMLLVMIISAGAGALLGIFFEPKTTGYRIINFMIELALVPLTIGYLKYVLDMIRGEKFSIDKMFDFYKNILPIVAASILASALVLGGTCLFIIPGIIIALALTMVNPIFADGETDPIEALKRSHEMMKGYKWDYFVFILSFIGWFLLVIVTLGIALIWVIPYVTVSSLIYYENLRENKVAVLETPIEEEVKEEKPVKKAPAKKTTTTKKTTTKKTTAKKTTTKK